MRKETFPQSRCQAYQVYYVYRVKLCFGFGWMQCDCRYVPLPLLLRPPLRFFRFFRPPLQILVDADHTHVQYKEMSSQAFDASCISFNHELIHFFKRFQLSCLPKLLLVLFQALSSFFVVKPCRVLSLV